MMSGRFLARSLHGILALFLLAGYIASAQARNSAAFVSQSVPTTMALGQTYPVSITVLNNGDTTWTAENQYRLGAQAPQDSSTWGLSRVELPGAVAPGQSVTFNFTVAAPVVLGVYNFQWRMVQETVEWFGDYSSYVAVQDGDNNAVIVTQSVPAVMTPGQTYPVSVTVQNTGNTTWTVANQYRLGSQNSQDNTRWGIARVDLPNDVPPGGTATFNFTVTAPADYGTYNFQWQMVQELVEWFGQKTPNIAVKDGVNDATFVSQNVPPSMAPGQGCPVSVTMKNTGSTTWTIAHQYRLGARNPQDNQNWGLARVELPNDVAPGDSVTFNFTVTAPATVGAYNFQWEMVEELIEWFGDQMTAQLGGDASGRRIPPTRRMVGSRK